MSANVTEWSYVGGVHERRYVKPNVAAAKVYLIGADDGDSRRWRMAVWRIDDDRPHAWWRYHTAKEAIAGADEELSAIVPGLKRGAT